MIHNISLHIIKSYHQEVTPLWDVCLAFTLFQTWLADLNSYHRKQLPQRLKVKVYHLQNGCSYHLLTFTVVHHVKRKKLGMGHLIKVLQDLGKTKQDLCPMMFPAASSTSCICTQVIIPSPAALEPSSGSSNQPVS